MKYYIKRVSVFVLIIAIADVLLGKVFDYMQANAKSGMTQRADYVINRAEEDVLVFGSSRATHSYSPDIIGDSLGCSFYNCGLDGMGILYAYPRLRMMLSRYTPKMIIYEMTPNFDFNSGDDVKYIKQLRPYYDRSEVKEIVNRIDNTEKYKCLSHMYRYNMCPTQLLRDNISTADKYYKGYEPLDNVLNYEPKTNTDYTEKRPQDPLKIEYMRKFVEICKKKGIMLVFTISPIYNNVNVTDAFTEGYKLSETYGIPLLNHANDERFMWKKEFFSDDIHLNDNGAQLYSRIIAQELNDIFKIRKI